MIYRGFIALISVTIISAILMAVIIGGSLVGFNSRSDVLDFESKERSTALADACVDTLLLQLAENNGTVTGGIVSVGTDPRDTCKILTLSDPYTIQGVFNNAYTDIQVSVDGDYTLTSYQEVPHF